MKFKFLEHTADVKFQAWGKTLEEAFKNSALALKETICEKIKVKEKIEKKIEIRGKDLEFLLFFYMVYIVAGLGISQSFFVVVCREVMYIG